MESTQVDLYHYRIEKAKDDLETAEQNLHNDKLSQSINRSYYSMFHATRALLALNKFDSRKHSGVIAFFNLHYIKTGKIERDFSRMLADAFDIRNESDYNDFYLAIREDAQAQLENSKKFLNRIQLYAENVLGISAQKNSDDKL